MSEKPSKINHIQHLLHRHRLRVITVLITVVGLVGLFVTSIVFFPSNEYTAEPIIPITEPDYLTAHDTISETQPTAATTAAAIEEKTIEEKKITSEITPLVLEASPGVPESENLTPVTVRSGQSLSSIFKLQKISQQQLVEMIKLPGVEKQIRALRKGKILEFDVDAKGQLQTFIMPISSTKKLIITRTPTGFAENTITEKLEASTKISSMRITSSFYDDGEKAGIPLTVLNNYLTIFKWSVDFQRDIHPGDKMSMNYEMVKNSRTNKIEISTIIAASYTHKNKTIYAIRYNDANGQSDYYDQNGNSLHKAFRRKPIDIGRISSPFNLHRLHPILGYVRPHTGTDFAAPYGTPIYATGDGRIILRGRKGGYGRCIMINNGNGIVTLYGHMSRFASQFNQGSSVKMGQVIGYIGTSGLADGPHVHYEFRVNKQFKNPMTVVLPNGASVPSKKKAAFVTYAKQEISLLNPTSMATPTVRVPTAQKT